MKYDKTLPDKNVMITIFGKCMLGKSTMDSRENYDKKVKVVFFCTNLLIFYGHHLLL